MNALRFALRSLVRQPARAALGVLGVAAVGALLFDMLLLSRGLIVSMRDLLDRTGWEVRVTASDDLPRTGRRLREALEAERDIAALPSVRSALAVRFIDARIDRSGGPPLLTTFQGVAGSARPPWTILRGRDAAASGELVINESIATTLEIQPGGTITLRASCDTNNQSLPPAQFRVAGIAEFPFAITSEHTVGGTFAALGLACGATAPDEADLILVTSTGDPNQTAEAIRSVRPDLRAVTNEEMVGRLQETGFSYFRQISTVLTTVTLSFALLLIAVLLTVSVNQRLGEIAALRALGFSRTRVVSDVLSESALIVGAGGLLSLPLGLLLARFLDRILQRMPGIPAELHFFVFEGRSLVIHLALLAITAVVAALYPMRVVSRLPIAATLRREVLD